MIKMFKIQPSNQAKLHTKSITLQAVEYYDNRYKCNVEAINVSSPEMTQFDMHNRQAAVIMLLANSNTFIKNF